MSISPARAAAFDILLRIEQTDAYASELLHSSQYARLSHADHGLATEIVMGVLRWQARLDQQISAASSQKLERLDVEVLTALRMAAYQIAFLSRVPGHAAVHESVELVKRARKRSAVPFANAVLRKLSTSGAEAHFHGQGFDAGLEALLAPAKNAHDLAEAGAHPLWLVERWVREFGLEAARKICSHDQRPPQTAVRVINSEIESELVQGGIVLAPGRLLASARYVESGDITTTPAFRAGRVSIQDEASQLVALLVGKEKNILDCCAAPGGKTRVIAEQNPAASVVAVELHAHRAQLLKKLVSAKNVEVVTGDILELPLPGQFDRVLADVPCSGTGTLARNPEIKWRLKLEDLADLQARQLAILQAAMRRVAPGGRVVYSTCSLEREENIDIVERAIGADAAFCVIDCKDELKRLQMEGELAWVDIDSLIDGSYLRTIPGVHPCDGFFAAILQKTSHGFARILADKTKNPSDP